MIIRIKALPIAAKFLLMLPLLVTAHFAHADSEPDAIALTPTTCESPDTLKLSENLEVTGIDETISLDLSGDAQNLYLNCFDALPGRSCTVGGPGRYSVSNGDKFTVVASCGASEEQKTASVVLGAESGIPTDVQSADWVLTTLDVIPDQFGWADKQVVDPGQLIATEIINLTDFDTNAKPVMKLLIPESLDSVEVGFGGSYPAFYRYYRNGTLPITVNPVVGKAGILSLRVNSPPVGEPALITLEVGDNTTRTSGTWTVSSSGDMVPDAYDFVDRSVPTPDSFYSSNVVTLSGLSGPTPMSVSRANKTSFTINGGPLQFGTATVHNGDQIQLRAQAGPLGDRRIANVNIGGVIDRWTLTTGDTIPNKFDFVDQSTVNAGVGVLSNTVTVSGLTAPTTVQLTGHPDALYRVNGGGFRVTDTLVSNGDQVQLRIVSGPLGDRRTAQLDIGGITDEWTLATGDTTPDPFDFVDRSVPDAASPTTSNTVVLSGMTAAGMARVHGAASARFSVNGGPFITGPVLVNNGDGVRLRMISGGMGTRRSAKLIVDEVEADWVVTVGDSVPDPFDFQDTSTLEAGKRVPSNSVRLTGLTAPAVLSLSGDPTVRVQINGGPQLAGEQLVRNGDVLVLRMNAGDLAQRRRATVFIGGVRDDWTLTTGDTTPDAYTFNNVTTTQEREGVLSNTVTLTGLTAPTRLTFSGHAAGLFSVNGGAFGRDSILVNNGDTVRLRLLSGLYDQRRTVSVDIGGVRQNWSVLVVRDTVPDAFDFEDQSVREPGAQVRSNTIGITGLTGAARLSLSGSGDVRVSVNSGPLQSGGIDVNNGDSVRLVVNAPAVGSAKNLNVTIGGITDRWRVNTLPSRSSNLRQLTSVRTGDPQSSVVSLALRVVDRNLGFPVNGLSVDDFVVQENGDAVSPNESFTTVEPILNLPYVVRTIFMLDISSSLSASDIANVKAAVRSAIADPVTGASRLLPRQQVAIYTFDDTVRSMIGYTDNVANLLNAVDSVERGGPSTNLYGAVISGVNTFNDSFSVTNGSQVGALVLITDGRDTSGLSTEAQAIAARGIKNAYAIAVGEDADTESLERIVGEENVFSIDGFGQIEAALSGVAESAANVTQGVYFVYYASPRRAGTHTLSVTLDGNPVCPETDLDCVDEIGGSFFAGSFSNVVPQLGFRIDPYVTDNAPAKVEATINFNLDPPSFVWAIHSNQYSNVILDVDALDPARAFIRKVPGAPDSVNVNLLLTDQVTGLNKISPTVTHPPVVD